MSSNPPDPKEYTKLLRQIQKQQRRCQQLQQTGILLPQQPLHTKGAHPENSGGQGLTMPSGTTLTGNPSNVPLKQSTDGTQQSNLETPAESQPFSVDSNQTDQQHQLLISAKLLATVNPSLAAAAVEQAMSIGPLLDSFLNPLIQSEIPVRTTLMHMTLIHKQQPTNLHFIRPLPLGTIFST